jgi:hypothetical protein
MQPVRKIRKLAAVAVLAVLPLVACTSEASKEAGQNLDAETSALAVALREMLKAQPIPIDTFSQERETLRLILSARSQGATGTAIFQNAFGEGIAWCPTLGSPIPSTYQLTATEQYVDLPDDGTTERVPVSLMEPTGVYPGDSQATWTLCLDDSGQTFPVYWEAPVAAAIAVLDPADFGLDNSDRIRPTEITFSFDDIATEGVEEDTTED